MKKLTDTETKGAAQALTDSAGSGEWWMSGWTRLYDKIKATDGFYTAKGTRCQPFGSDQNGGDNGIE